jgi:transcription initiation factor TFIIF subunit beta
LECRPFADKSYLQLKVEEMKKVSEPARKVIQLDRVVQSYKPVADHKHNVSANQKQDHWINSIGLIKISLTSCPNDALIYLQIEYDEKKKTEGKKSRDDKEKVQEMLFNAFEKHQYYNLKDLVRLTNQAVVS